MEKEILLQYTDLVKEEKEIKHRISLLESEIDKLERRVESIKVVVKSGDKRHIVEGYTEDQQRLRTELMVKKMLLSQRTALLTTLDYEISEKVNEVEIYIASIEDSFMRRLVSFRVVDGLKWEEVAVKMGGNNTEDSVKKAFYRFVR